jgi:phosphoglycolate phosphatase-like HAD superfamily hydrolase
LRAQELHKDNEVLSKDKSDGGRKSVIVDMDGTLADVRHRLHYLEGRRKNWKSFFAHMHKDPPNPEIVDMVRKLARDHEIVVVSGRPDTYQQVTEAWLRRYQVPYQEIHMRPAGDHRPDHIVKREILDRLLGAGKKIDLVIDDRPSVCDMWRECGLKVHQVKSDFWERNA